MASDTNDAARAGVGDDTVCGDRSAFSVTAHGSAVRELNAAFADGRQRESSQATEPYLRINDRRADTIGGEHI